VRNTAWQRAPGTGEWEWAWAPLDTGMVDWAELVALCRQTGFAGYLSNEDMLDVPRHRVTAGDPHIRALPERLGAAPFLRELIARS
jgi:sugar phosphate isomerase/epimerase